MEGFRVGEIARQAGVNLQTIHYYERQGLLPRPPRTESNYRVYPQDAVRRVQFIKRAQELGFTLKEIKELLSLRAAPRAGCADVRSRAQAKVQNIDEKMHTTLNWLVPKMPRPPSIAECSERVVRGQTWKQPV